MDSDISALSVLVFRELHFSHLTPAHRGGAQLRGGVGSPVLYIYIYIYLVRRHFGSRRVGFQVKRVL